MKLAVCQTDMAWGDAAVNLCRTERFVAAAGADLVVLPEMFATGFGAPYSEADSETVVSRMVAWASRFGCAVTGSVAVDDGAGLRNRMYFVKPSGETAWYDKRHLFRPGGEERTCRCGDRRVVVEYGGWRFLLLVCYDLRFPVWCRNRGDYDVLLCVASWPASRRMAWQTLLRARAIENQCYVVGANRVGRDPATSYAGDSVIVDFKGGTLAEAGAEAGICTADLDREALRRFREAFPVWRDADDFALSGL